MLNTLKTANPSRKEEARKKSHERLSSISHTSFFNA